MVQPPKDLDDVARHGGSIRAECASCGRVALFVPGEVAVHWRRKRWDSSWPAFARHLKCQCGERWPMVSWIVTSPPPDDDPQPPRPRFAREGAARVPEGVNVVPLKRRRRA